MNLEGRKTGKEADMTKRMEIVAGKNYITRGGRKVKIYDPEGGGNAIARHHGAIEEAIGWWGPCAWDAYGENAGDNRSNDIVGEWPEPKLRPWKPEEVPLGAQIRLKGTDLRHVIVCVSGDNIEAGHTFKAKSNWVCIHCEHSTDGGKTWHPCGVIESVAPGGAK